MRSLRPVILALLALASVSSRGFAQTPPLTPDVPAHFEAAAAAADYVKRVVMIPMRDGVKLYTVIVIPKGAAHAPIILTRTPYNAAGRAERLRSTHMFVAGGVTLGLLLLGIRNAWDTVTHIVISTRNRQS